MDQGHFCVGSFLVREDGTVDVETKFRFFASLDEASLMLSSKLLVCRGRENGLLSIIVGDYVENRVICLRTGIQVSFWATEDDELTRKKKKQF